MPSALTFKSVKKGYTTGTCAQAAAKGAAIMLSSKRVIDSVEVEIPSGVRLELELIDQEIGEDFAICGVVKDAGDDPDVTDGVRIYARVRFSEEEGVVIKGGEGVGAVTKPGLAVEVGEPAINPVPREMIRKELSDLLCGIDLKGAEVVISVPGGEELAKRTFNPRLGIVGGISIIGTTGIVEPKSTDAYKKSLSLQLDVLKVQGHKKAVLILGYVGEKFCNEVLRLDESVIIKIGDHIGYMLKECAKRDMEDVLLIGHIGKLVKVANNQFDTNIKFGDDRIKTIARYAELSGAGETVIKEVLRQKTAEAVIEILRRNDLMKVFDRIAKEVIYRIGKYIALHLQYKGPEGTQNIRNTHHAIRMTKLSCIILSLKGEVLADA